MKSERLKEGKWKKVELVELDELEELNEESVVVVPVEVGFGLEVGKGFSGTMFVSFDGQSSASGQVIRSTKER
jgi:hypothetical protein